ncbi:MAG: DUF86 domain-containing protein [Cyanobacteria bacterium J06555_13]
MRDNKRDTREYLKDVYSCITQIEDYTQGGKNIFLTTPIIQDAVVRNFEVMGEATKRVPELFRRQYPAIQWRKIAGLRDVLIHDYFEVNYDEVWGIVERDLPILKMQIKKILEE